MMRRCFALAVTLIFASALVTGCGGGGRSASAVPGSGGGGPAGNGARAKAWLKLVFSPSSNTASNARKPATISSSSESAMITVNGSLQQTFNIAAPQCTIGQTITCDFTVNAYVGTDTFLIQTYSGPNGTGTLLDQVTLTFTVSATGANSISATLGPAVSTLADSGAGSLRAAIAAANPGDTISFAPSLSGTITLSTGAITLAQNITVAGPGAGTISVSGNNSSAIFLVNAGVNTTLSGLTLMNGSGAPCVGDPQGVCGGAVQNEGILAVNNVTFTNNTASPASFGDGGAIYNDVGATLSVANSTFAGNKAQFGGAIGDHSSTTTIATSTFTSNTVQSGLDDDNASQGGAIFAADDITITGSTFTSNVATGLSPVGGAIAELGCTNSGLTLTSSKLNTNQAGLPANGDPSGSGGAVYDGSGCTTQLTSDAFTSNVASGTTDSYGGAVEADLGSSIALLGGDTFTSNSVTSQSTTQYSAGGAIYITPNGNALVVTGSGNAFTGNFVTAGPSETGGNANGGAIDLDSGGFLDMSTATGTTFSQNVASAPDSQGNAFGGAIEYFGTQGCDKCSKFRRGGQVDAHHSGRPQFARIAARARQFVPHGSAKAIARESLSQTQSTRRQTKTLVASSNTIIATFTQNKAMGGSTSEFGVSGGAIDVEEATSFTILVSTFTGNQASASSAYGGAVSSEGSTIAMTGDVLTGNSAGNGGGAVSFAQSTMTMSTSTLSQNSVTAPALSGDGGGGIWAGNGGTSTVVQSTLSANTVAGSLANTGGGGAMIVDAMIQFTNDTITGNTSGVDGGGVETANDEGGCSTLTNVTFYANVASGGAGGNLSVGSGSNVTTTNSLYAQGSAHTNGPDIMNSGSFSSDDWNYIATTVSGEGLDSNSDDQVNAGQVTLPALGNNGGPTQTMSDAGLSAIVAVIPFGGTCGDSNVSQDQRSLYRGAVNSACDIGAFENGGTTTPNNAPPSSPPSAPPLKKRTP